MEGWRWKPDGGTPNSTAWRMPGGAAPCCGLGPRLDRHAIPTRLARRPREQTQAAVALVALVAFAGGGGGSAARMRRR